VTRQNGESGSSKRPSGLSGSTGSGRAAHHEDGPWGRLGRALRSIGPFALALTVYGLALDHLPDGWFKYEWLKYVLAGLCALAAGLLVKLGVDAAARRGTALSTTRATTDGTVEGLFADVRDQVAKDLRTDTSTGVELSGWSQYLGDGVPPSAIGTSYGLRIVLALDVDGSKVNKAELVQSILRQQKPGGGWAASTQRDHPRPEVTAWVLEAIVRAGVDGSIREQLTEVLEELAVADDALGLRSTTVISSLVDSFCEVAPSSPTLPKLVRTLVDGAVNAEGFPASWGRELTNGPKGSPAHTARAVVALARASRVLGEEEEMRPLLDSATTWLNAGTFGFGPDYEELRRSVVGGVEGLYIGHFTAAWVARALMAHRIEADVESRLADVMAEVVKHQKNGVWTWTDGRKPLWMMYQGLVVVRQYALRRTALVR